MLRRGWVALASFAFAGAALATWWVLPRELGAPLARNDLRTNAPEPRAWARPAVRPLESLFLYAEIASAPAEGEPYERHAPVRRDADIFSARGGVAEAAKPFERHAPAPTPARSAAVIDALGRCAEAGDADCLFTLARIDRAAALASGRRAAALSRPEPLRDELLAGLIRFRSDAELAEHLRALGFSDAVPAPPSATRWPPESTPSPPAVRNAPAATTGSSPLSPDWPLPRWTASPLHRRWGRRPGR